MNSFQKQLAKWGFRPINELGRPLSDSEIAEAAQKPEPAPKQEVDVEQMRGSAPQQFAFRRDTAGGNGDSLSPRFTTDASGVVQVTGHAPDESEKLQGVVPADSRVVGAPQDSRTTIPVDSRTAGSKPQNSRA